MRLDGHSIADILHRLGNVNILQGQYRRTDRLHKRYRPRMHSDDGIGILFICRYRLRPMHGASCGDRVVK